MQQNRNLGEELIKGLEEAIEYTRGSEQGCITHDVWECEIEEKENDKDEL